MSGKNSDPFAMDTKKSSWKDRLHDKYDIYYKTFRKKTTLQNLT
jgi:hypothetical protein